MAAFEDLPIEIVLEIVKLSTPINPTGDRIGKDDLCKLRLVSRRLNAAVSPVLFAEVRLGFDDADTPEPDPAPDCSRCQEIIIALANGSTRVFEHTQRLELCTQKLYWTNDDCRAGLAELKNLVVDKIFDAVSSLKNLRIVRYFCNPKHDPEALGIEFIRALSTLPSFEGFTYLQFPDNPPPSFTLQPLRNLTVFHALWSWDKPVHLIPELAALLTRCPNLSELCLGGGPSSTHDDATFHEIFARLDETNDTVLKLKRLDLHGVLVTPGDIKKHIRHLQELAFLRITNNPAPEASTVFGSICSILQQHAIFLKGISTDTVNDHAFLSYLTSYSGLTQLKLGGQNRSTDTPGVVERVYTQVLPKHKETLEDLQLGTPKMDVWCEPPTKEQLAELVKCQKLRRLEVCIALPDDDTATIFEKWFEVGLQLPNLAHLVLVPNLAPSVTVLVMKSHKLRKEVVKRFREERGMRFRVNND